MKLAKPVFDIALFTLDSAAMMAFWESETGACHDSHIVIREGHVQDRMNLNGSMLKINGVHSLSDKRDTGYASLMVACDKVDTPRELRDVDGNQFTLVPPGYDGIYQLALRVKVRNRKAHMNYYRRALGMEEVSDGIVQVGKSRIIFDEDPATPNHPNSELSGGGWRYLTLECDDVAAAYASYVEGGGTEAVPLQQMANNLVRFALVRDPDGNWVELVERRSADSPFHVL